MSEFCTQCAAELFGPDIPSDFQALCNEGEVVGVICEGCGPIYVDHRGVCQHHGGGTAKDCYSASLEGARSELEAAVKEDE